MVRPLWWLLVAALAPALVAQQAAPAADAGGVIPPAVDAVALFAASCAQCHGLDGSGTGPTVLDRPARDFKEGGFSFGNTPETIARTIAHGIPGSPMPAFGGALSDVQLRALAEFVLTLGPPVKEVSAAETLLHVTDRPLVVRGILPPLEEGGPMIPRGLLIGTPDGLSFQYAADDVRLLAVRQGDFVRRADWGDRGGLPLEPLGKVVWSSASTSAGPWSSVAWDQPTSPLRARLLSTGDVPAAVLSYVIAPAEADPMLASALVTERPGIAMLGSQAGFTRRFEVSNVGPWLAERSEYVGLRVGLWAEELVPDSSGGRAWVREAGPDTGEVLRLLLPSTASTENVMVASDPDGVTFLVSAARDLAQAVTFELQTFMIRPWTPEIAARLRQELAR